MYREITLLWMMMYFVLLVIVYDGSIKRIADNILMKVFVIAYLDMLEVAEMITGIEDR